jgi:outer membrane protein assembly factor BamB
MERYEIFVLSLLIALTLAGCNREEHQWTHFRGNNLDGKSTTDICPVQWAPDSGIMWKTFIHGRGWSSPTVYGNQVWVTTATETGTEMSGVCLDLNTGETIYDIVVFRPDSVQGKHDINSYATPTPCIEQHFVYVHFGHYGTACFDTRDGSEVWKRDDLPCTHVQGPGSSPILYGNLLILHLEGTERQYITALNKTDGHTVWETNRPKDVIDRLEPIGKKAYITPLIIDIKGRKMMISNGSAACMAYDPDTGEEIWRIIRGEDSTIAMPFAEDGLVFFHTGFVTGPDKERFAELMAVDPDGSGDIAKSNLKWKMETPILQLSTPVINKGYIYTIDTKSILMCIEAETGNIVKIHQVEGQIQCISHSGCRKIYISSTRGETMVFQEGPDLELLAENRLEGEIWASPAAVGNSLLIRTSKFLYRIGS